MSKGVNCFSFNWDIADLQYCVSGRQQSESVINIHMSLLYFTLL